ncbi:acyltransferase domain-containing protein, partial [Nostoc sp. CALU 546]|uniref:acyltransferase domain-containing protein n=1 Tax=Nostoc sp. CALU 546 TaxID=1867241 RepID=UPI003B684633
GAGGQGSRGAGEQGRKYQLLVVSAKTNTALETATANLVRHLQEHPQINLADVAYTLQVGRQAFEHRRILVCCNQNDAVEALTSQNPQRVFTYHHKPSHRPVIFMFSGQGTQYVNMARELYEVETTFKTHVDTCAEILQQHLNLDIRQILFQDETKVTEQLQQTALTQPGLFVIEYALAQLWMEWGVHPEAMIGHSIGEYVAATIAGVFSLEDALAIVATRGRLMQQLPTGSMLAIPLPVENLRSLLTDDTQIAAVNSPSSCVVSGKSEAITALHNQLLLQGIECRMLHTSHAFHSEMMQPIVPEFVEVVNQVKLNVPSIRFISNVTGTWISDSDATNPSYWGEHLRQTVRFSDGISQLLQFEGVFLEVGPGRTLTTFTKQHLQSDFKQLVVNCLRHVKEEQSDFAYLLQALGRLWLFGVEIDWSGFYIHQQPLRLPLPTYPFERQRYWIDAKSSSPSFSSEPIVLHEEPSSQLDSSYSYFRPNISNSYVAPTNELEKQVTEIWQEVIGIAQVGIYDNFYELGGDSLIATQLVSRLRAKFPVELPLRDLLVQAMIPAKQAEMIEQLLLEKIEELSEEQVAVLLAGAS